MNVLCSWTAYSRDLRGRLQRAFTDQGYPLPTVMADSGAFTAWAQGTRLDPHAYGSWLLENRDLLHLYVNLDVMSDWRTTARHQELLEGMDLQPLPVWHGGSPWAELRRLCRQYRYVGVGNIARRGRAGLAPWLTRVFQEADGARLHGFGLTAWRLIAAFPFASVDSTSWGHGHRYGKLPLWTGRTMFTVEMAGREKSRATILQHARLIRSYGLDPQLLADRSRYHHRWAAGLAGASWLRFEATLQQQRPAFRLYLADGSEVNLAHAWEGWARAEEAQHAAG